MTMEEEKEQNEEVMIQPPIAAQRNICVGSNDSDKNSGKGLTMVDTEGRWEMVLPGAKRLRQKEEVGEGGSKGMNNNDISEQNSI